jgi:uncharacterized protein involved in type VI secretion and phage assembly
MDAREELSRDFRIDLELLCDNAFISLKSMMAKMATVSLVRADGSLRYLNGYATEFRLLRTDGGFVFYQSLSSRIWQSARRYDKLTMSPSNAHLPPVPRMAARLVAAAGL